MADLLTTYEVQTLLHVDRTTIYRMVESGRLPAIRVGKQWRFSRPEIERWLHEQAASGNAALPIPDLVNQAVAAPPPVLSSPAAQAPTVKLSLRELLPLPCSQLIQDVFADILGVMMVITDMQGRPATVISNPCGFYTALIADEEALGQCIRSWQQIAADPVIEPRFYPSEMGLLCARGLIRMGSELKGMAVIGGIAPEAWPPGAELVASLAETFGVSPAYVEAHADAVYRLDKAAQERALRSVQRIADVFSHITEDRNALCGRLQAIASLAKL